MVPLVSIKISRQPQKTAQLTQAEEAPNHAQWWKGAIRESVTLFRQLTIGIPIEIIPTDNSSVSLKAVGFLADWARWEA